MIVDKRMQSVFIIYCKNGPSVTLTVFPFLQPHMVRMLYYTTKIHNCGEVRLIPVTTYRILSVWGKSEREQFKMKYGLSTNFGKRELQEDNVIKNFYRNLLFSDVVLVLQVTYLNRFHAWETVTITE